MHTPPAHVQVVDFVVTRVNQERQTVRPGGSAPVCQSITPVLLGVRLRWRLPGTRTVRISVRYGPKLTRLHRLRLARGTGTDVLELSPRDERLPGERFAVGEILVTVRLPGAAEPVTRARMRFSGRTTC